MIIIYAAAWPDEAPSKNPKVYTKPAPFLQPTKPPSSSFLTDYQIPTVTAHSTPRRRPDIMPSQESPYDTTIDRPDDTPAFAASPPSVPVSTSPPSLSPTSTRKCEGCSSPHSGTYGSGRFCSATCAKKVGARHKWAARAAAPGAPRRPPARHTIPDSPCESCAKLHDKSYGSGRFCSVHCARRVAATRKWEKSRSEKTKRLEAIRPAMLAPPPDPCPIPVLTGKRRRVVGRHFEQLSISDSPPPLYVSHQYSHQRLEVPTAQIPTPPPNATPTAPASSPILSVPAPIPTAYLPTAPMQYAQVQMQDGFTSPVIYPTDARASLCYGYPGVASYAVHPTASPVDTASYTATSPSPSPSPSPIPQRSHVPYPTVSIVPRSLPTNYVLPRGPAYETENVSGTASPARIDETAIGCQQAAAARVPKTHTQVPRKDKPTETSESAARALLCLQRS